MIFYFYYNAYILQKRSFFMGEKNDFSRIDDDQTLERKISNIILNFLNADTFCNCTLTDPVIFFIYK